MCWSQIVVVLFTYCQHYERGQVIYLLLVSLYNIAVSRKLLLMLVILLDNCATTITTELDIFTVDTGSVVSIKTLVVLPILV